MDTGLEQSVGLIIHTDILALVLGNQHQELEEEDEDGLSVLASFQHSLLCKNISLDDKGIHIAQLSIRGLLNHQTIFGSM